MSPVRYRECELEVSAQDSLPARWVSSYVVQTRSSHQTMLGGFSASARRRHHCVRCKPRADCEDVSLGWEKVECGGDTASAGHSPTSTFGMSVLGVPRRACQV